MDFILGIGAFNLDKILEMDDAFLEDAGYARYTEMILMTYNHHIIHVVTNSVIEILSHS